jgi:hypothetical protein
LIGKFVVMMVLLDQFVVVRQNLVNSQYQIFGSRKLVRIDRLAKSVPGVSEMTAER